MKRKRKIEMKSMKLAAMLAMFGLGLGGCGDETKVYVDPPEQVIIVYTSPDADQSGRAIDGDGSIDRAIPEADAGIQPDAALWDAATSEEPDQGNGTVDAAEATNAQDSATDKPTPDAGREAFNPDMGENPEPDAAAQEPSDTPDMGAVEEPDSETIEIGGDPCIYIISPDSDGDGITDACEEAAAEPECRVNEDCSVPDDTCLDRTTRRQYFGVTGQCVEGTCQFRYQDFDCTAEEAPDTYCSYGITFHIDPRSAYCDDHLEAWGAICRWDYSIDRCHTPECNAQGTGCAEWNVDTDGDGIGNDFDNCDLVVNPDQADNDRNGVGAACEVESTIRHFTFTWDGTVAYTEYLNVRHRVENDLQEWAESLHFEINCLDELAEAFWSVTMDEFSPELPNYQFGVEYDSSRVNLCYITLIIDGERPEYTPDPNSGLPNGGGLSGEWVIYGQATYTMDETGDTYDAIPMGNPGQPNRFYGVDLSPGHELIVATQEPPFNN